MAAQARTIAKAAANAGGEPRTAAECPANLRKKSCTHAPSRDARLKHHALWLYAEKVDHAFGENVSTGHKLSTTEIKRVLDYGER